MGDARRPPRVVDEEVELAEVLDGASHEIVPLRQRIASEQLLRLFHDPERSPFYLDDRAPTGAWTKPRASAVTRAAPWLIVQPMWPWPVLNHRFFIRDGPRMGVPSGVMGLRPAQKLALLQSASCPASPEDD